MRVTMRIKTEAREVEVSIETLTEDEVSVQNFAGEEVIHSRPHPLTVTNDVRDAAIRALGGGV